MKFALRVQIYKEQSQHYHHLVVLMLWQTGISMCLELCSYRLVRVPMLTLVHTTLMM